MRRRGGCVRVAATICRSPSVAALMGLALLATCLPRGRYACDQDADCGSDGARCEANHVCSTPDETCATTGRRYARFDDAVDRVAGTCVPVPCEGDPVRALRSGASHSCLLRASGAVMCWGRNEAGQLGDGSTTPRSSPTAVVGLAALSDARALALGDAHSCVLRGDGDVWCWGRNDGGQLGDGLLASRSTPSQVPRLKQVEQIAAGAATTCARTRGGQVFCWGDNRQGELGLASPDANRLTPVAVPGLSGATDLSMGAHHACVVTLDRTVRCWGANAVGQLGDGTTTTSRAPAAAITGLIDVIQVASGSLHSCARTIAGNVACWGFNQTGQLGDGTRTARSVAASVVLPGPLTVAALSSGAQHVCAIGSNETLLCWGSNSSGQLGDGTTTGREVPSFVAGLAGVVEIAPGEGHTCARTRDGGLWCWGDNRAGQLGTGGSILRPSPSRVVDLDGVKSVSSGADHVCVLRGDGRVACWGAGGFGRLGSGSDRDRSLPAHVELPGTADAVAAGGEQSCAVMTGGTACWGRGTSGQLGNGVADSWLPLASPSLGGIDRLALGRAHGCARRADTQTVWCWGAADQGQAGTPVAEQPVPPRSVTPPVPAQSVVAAASYSCALDPSGAVHCWGRGAEGQLGSGQGGDGVPVVVPLPAPAVAVAAGRAHGCAALTDGQVFCWGRGTDGQLGGGGALDRGNPAAVPNVAAAVAVTAGDGHACALSADGSVFCWGANASGQLGNGTTAATATAVRSGLPRSYRAIAAGRAHTCALRSDGRVDCWGDDTSGQLGDGVRLTEPTPRPVALVCP